MTAPGSEGIVEVEGSGVEHCDMSSSETFHRSEQRDDPAVREGLFHELEAMFRGRSATVAVIGLGYVGIPLCFNMHDAGFQVVGYDVDPEKVDALRNGRAYLEHLGVEEFQRLSTSDRFVATSNPADLGDADAILVCVPTPLGEHREPDLRYVVGSGADIGRTLRRGQLLVLESTTYPGTTRNEFLDSVVAHADPGLELGQDYWVAYPPEREDPGRSDQPTKRVPKLVGGLDAPATELATALYESAYQHVVQVASSEVAEAAKLLENVFRAVNIALVNEMKMILSDLDIDVWEVIEAASTKPYGFMPFYPGPGLGGHCIPVDPFYLSWKAREVGRHAAFVELAGQVNTDMPAYVVSRVVEALNTVSKAVRGARILVLGMAYKPDVGDVRESPSFALVERLEDMGAEVEYHDPHVRSTSSMRNYEIYKTSVALSAESVSSFDLVLISTAHSDVDYEMVATAAALVVDTRNVMRPWSDFLGARLIRS